MTTKGQSSTGQQAATIKAYEEKIKAQVQEAKAKLDLLEATAREMKGQAEITAISGLKAKRDSIDARLQDLRATSDANVSRAKAAIEADVESFKTTITSLVARIKPHKGAK